jgi:AcrR family transcriptional regulator
VPRPFSPDERARIRQRLRDAGREAFGGYGLRRTSVDDLAQAAGISKGAFYLFFASKEALLLDLLERFEADFQRRVLDDVLRPEFTPVESLRALLHAALVVRGSDPVLRNLTDSDAAVLLRRISPEHAVALRQADVVSVRRFIDYWSGRGARIDLDAEELTGLLRAIVLTTLREQEIGPDVYPRVVETMIDAVAAHVMPANIPANQEPAHAS